MAIITEHYWQPDAGCLETGTIRKGPPVAIEWNARDGAENVEPGHPQSAHILRQPTAQELAKYHAQQSAIARANARTMELTAAGLNWTAREMAQGIEITIERPAFGRGNVSRSVEIICY